MRSLRLLISISAMVMCCSQVTKTEQEVLEIDALSKISMRCSVSSEHLQTVTQRIAKMGNHHQMTEGSVRVLLTTWLHCWLAGTWIPREDGEIPCGPGTQGCSRPHERIFASCKKTSPDFDGCIKRAFNKVRPYFKIGIPEMGVAPFDPHFAREVKQARAINGIGYTLTLTSVYERGWSHSTVTKYKTDWENQRIVYSQYFPEKWLNGDYEFKGDAFGLGVLRSGTWNMTLRDYSQTTRIKRNGTGVDVHVEVDHIGDMEIHVGNLVRGNGILERMLDRLINATWKPGFAVIRPLINDLVSTAFTDIWSHSFKDFPIDNFIRD